MNSRETAAGHAQGYDAACWRDPTLAINYRGVGNGFAKRPRRGKTRLKGKLPAAPAAPAANGGAKAPFVQMYAAADGARGYSTAADSSMGGEAAEAAAKAAKKAEKAAKKAAKEAGGGDESDKKEKKKKKRDDDDDGEKPKKKKKKDADA